MIKYYDEILIDDYVNEHYLVSGQLNGNRTSH